MKSIRISLFFFALISTAFGAKKHAVILTGANNHDWKGTTPVIEEVLKASGEFDVTVVTEPEVLTKAYLADKDLLISNWNAYGKNKPAPWSDELKANYVEFVRQGGGHVVIHAGSSSFVDWDDYQKICLATWKGKTSHKKPHAFEVRFADCSHPITRDLESFSTTDELWFSPFVQDDAHVLAEAWSKTSGKWEPSALSGQFGEGRTFCLLLGHSRAYMQNEGFQKLLLNGVRWVAK